MPMAFRRREGGAAGTPDEKKVHDPVSSHGASSSPGELAHRSKARPEGGRHIASQLAKTTGGYGRLIAPPPPTSSIRHVRVRGPERATLPSSGRRRQTSGWRQPANPARHPMDCGGRRRPAAAASAKPQAYSGETVSRREAPDFAPVWARGPDVRAAVSDAPLWALWPLGSAGWAICAGLSTLIRGFRGLAIDQAGLAVLFAFNAWRWRRARRKRGRKQRLAGRAQGNPSQSRAGR